jgi:hypothetical protein
VEAVERWKVLDLEGEEAVCEFGLLHCLTWGTLPGTYGPSTLTTPPPCQMGWGMPISTVQVEGGDKVQVLGAAPSILKGHHVFLSSTASYLL